MKPRIQSRWFRSLLAILAVMVLYWPFANFFWTMFPITPANAQPGGIPHFITAPVGELTNWITIRTWRFTMAVPEAIFAPLLAIGFYAILTKWAGPLPETKCRCRRCGSVLKNLREPNCPTCAEPI